VVGYGLSKATTKNAVGARVTFSLLMEAVEKVRGAPRKE
jgi:hypothetical protein